MKTDKYRLAQITIVVVIAFALVAGVVQMGKDKENDKDRAVSQEFVGCLSAICINKGPGQPCLELNSSITTVVVTEDANIIGAKRIVIQTSDKSCGTSNFK